MGRASQRAQAAAAAPLLTPLAARTPAAQGQETAAEATLNALSRFNSGSGARVRDTHSFGHCPFQSCRQDRATTGRSTCAHHMRQLYSHSWVAVGMLHYNRQTAKHRAVRQCILKAGRVKRHERGAATLCSTHLHTRINWREAPVSSAVLGAKMQPPDLISTASGEQRAPLEPPRRARSFPTLLAGLR